MSSSNEKTSYRLDSLERKVKGMQQQINVLNARAETTEKRQEIITRNLKIKADARIVPQKKLAEIYKLSPGRISQIVRKVS